MNSRLAAAAAALLVIQVVHGAIPAETSSEGYVGADRGRAHRGRVDRRAGRRGPQPRWAAPVIGITGAIVAIGFILYHALPWHIAGHQPVLR